MTIITCQHCRYWDGSPGQTLGQCRKYAPVPVNELSRARHASWPSTRPTDWCGEGVRHAYAVQEQGT